MAFKYSKGSTVQGDIKAADDTQRDTMIDFGEDQIDFQTSGSVRLKIENDTITTTIPVHISGSAVEGLRIAKGGSDYRAIVFEVDGADNANISVSNAENFVIQNEMNGKDIQFWVNPNAGSSVQAMTIKESGLIGVGTTSPISELDVSGKIAITTESSTPSQPSDGQGYLYSKSDGKIYWRSHDLSETDLTATGGGGGGGGGGDDFDESFSSITNATGDVDHNCSSTQTFLHTSISAAFVVNLTNFSLSSGESTIVTLILVQGSTGHLPSGIKIGGSSQDFAWKSSTYPSATSNVQEIITFKIINNSGTYLVLADIDTYGVPVPTDPVTNGSVLFLDTSNNSSYGGSGTTWSDISGQNNHGTITNGPVFSADTKLFTFDGSNDFVDLPDGFADFSSGITLFFVSDFAGTNNSYERMIDLSNGADVDNILFSRETTTTTLRYDIRDGVNGNSAVTVANGVLNDTVASYAATDDGYTTKLYRNGVLLLSSGTSNLPRNVTRTQNFLAKSPWGDGFLEGKMGVAVVYTRALSDEEIAQNHNYYVPIYSL